jgi:hypothetical protein
MPSPLIENAVRQLYKDEKEIGRLRGIIKALLDLLERVLPELPEPVSKGSDINRQLRRAREAVGRADDQT